MHYEVHSKPELLAAIGALNYYDDNVIVLKGKAFKTTYRIPKAVPQTIKMGKRIAPRRRVDLHVPAEVVANNRRKRMLAQAKKLRVAECR